MGVGKRVELSKQPEHANLNTERLRSSEEPRRVYRVPTSQLQVKDMGTRDKRVVSYVPENTEINSSARSSKNDMLERLVSAARGYCLKLDKSLYGLKQAPRNWNKNIVEYIKSIGFKQCILDNCLFVKKVGDETYLISLYVDDILIAGSDVSKIEGIKQEFMMRYEMKELGEVNHYLV